MTIANAHCLCSDIKVQATLPSKWVAHCHCRLCRRAHGAAFVTWVGMDVDRCTIDDRHERLRWHASSAEAERGFCTRCGATMLFRSQRWPGELHITLAHFADPVDRAPQLHYYWGEHVAWASVDPHDGLRRETPVS